MLPCLHVHTRIEVRGWLVWCRTGAPHVLTLLLILFAGIPGTIDQSSHVEPPLGIRSALVELAREAPPRLSELTQSVVPSGMHHAVQAIMTSMPSPETFEAVVSPLALTATNWRTSAAMRARHWLCPNCQTVVGPCRVFTREDAMDFVQRSDVAG